MSTLTRLAERAVRRRMRGLRRGRLTVRHGDATTDYGPGGGPRAVVDVHDAAFFRSLALGGHIGAAESYVRGEWTAEDLAQVVRLLAANRDVIGDSEIQIADGLFLAPLDPEEHDAVMMFLNHSCEPNAGVMGNVVFVAMREIEAGEEVTIDYAMIDDGDFEMECRCGHDTCRRRIRGDDWKLASLQRKYGRFFSAYLLAKL